MEKDLFLNKEDVNDLQCIILQCLDKVCSISCYDDVVFYSSLLVKLEYLKREIVDREV